MKSKPKTPSTGGTHGSYLTRKKTQTDRLDAALDTGRSKPTPKKDKKGK